MFSSKFVIVHFTWFINMNKCIFVVFRLSVCVYFLSVNSKRNLASETVFFYRLSAFLKTSPTKHSQPTIYAFLRYAVCFETLKLRGEILCSFLVWNGFLSINSMQHKDIRIHSQPKWGQRQTNCIWISHINVWNEVLTQRLRIA